MNNLRFEVAGSGVLRAGAHAFIPGRAPLGGYDAFLECDRETGFFYVRAGSRILCAMAVYASKAPAATSVLRRADILWSDRDEYVALLVEGDAHCLCDVARRQGYCRTAFPKANRPLADVDQRILAALSQGG